MEDNKKTSENDVVGQTLCYYDSEKQKWVDGLTLPIETMQRQYGTPKAYEASTKRNIDFVLNRISEEHALELIGDNAPIEENVKE